METINDANLYRATCRSSAHLCWKMSLDPNDLLSDRLILNSCRLLLCSLVCSSEYSRLYTVWKGKQCFSKRESKVGEATRKADSLHNLKAQLRALAVCKIMVLTRIFFCAVEVMPGETQHMLLTLPVLFYARTTLKGAIQLLQSIIHVPMLSGYF